jgi:hypothetical protein
MCKTGRLLLSGTAVLTALVWGGCKTPPPKPSGYLSDYSHLQQVNDSTWQYLDKSKLAAYSAFTIAPTKVMVKEYWGTTFTADQQEKLAAVFRQKVTDRLSVHYKVVGTPGPNTAELRAAITQAYRVGNSLALGVEAEVVDPQSRQQLAAIRGVRVGPPEAGFRMGLRNPTGVGGDITEAWWNLPSAVTLMDQWADQIRNMVEEARAH